MKCLICGSIIPSPSMSTECVYKYNWLHKLLDKQINLLEKIKNDVLYFIKQDMTIKGRQCTIIKELFEVK